MANPNPTPPPGRPKGTPNKATADARAAIALFIEGNVDRLNGWLDDIAEDDPKDAFNAFMSVIEYHVPKLARTEHQIDPEANRLIVVVKQFTPEKK